jgi:hypothetical protein
MRRSYIISLLLFTATMLCGSGVASAQSGMDFEEFRVKLQKYFDDELIDDLKISLPKGTEYRVWGWDVGDFSGDGFHDVAFTVRTAGARRNEVTVYLFVDNDGFLVNISAMAMNFVEIPLEVGVVIKEGTCYVTQKRRSESWMMRGYRYVNGAVALADEFVSERIEDVGHESFRSYQTLETKDRYLSEKSDDLFKAEYLTLPCYGRGRQITAGYVSDLFVGSVRYAHEGAYWWKGETDASFLARAAYDDDNLYFVITVRDSNVVTGWCDTCPSDRLEIWMDATPPYPNGSRYVEDIRRGEPVVRTVSDSGLYAFSVKIGDFENIRPSVKVRTTDELDLDQEQAIEQIRVVTAQRSDGYVVKIRIPFLLLGYDRVPLDEQFLTELGCTISLYDVDNEFRADETTRLSSSPLDAVNPSTYGAIRFVPEGRWYGQCSNIYTEAVMTALSELGF